MKKFLQFLPLLILPMAFILMSYSSGSPGGRTGSPGDNGNSCVQCHNSFSTISVSDWITTDIPAGGYELSEVYNITMTGTHVGVSKFGFEFTAEDSEGNKVGTLSILNSSETQLTNGTVAATHTSQGNTPTGDSKTWTVEWTAPDDPIGDVTFYASFNAANGNGGTSGDQIYLGSLTVGEIGSGSGPDLIFSEYAEGSSNNKYVEIYNGTGVAVDLSNYNTHRISNGGEWDENIYPLEGILADGDVYVIANASADPTILAEADITSTLTYFNGNDAVGLSKNDGLGGWIIIDAIGEDGPDPGSSWDVAGVSGATGEHTLVRKPDVCEPTTDWMLSAGTNADDSQWVVFPQDNWDNLGFHISTCQGGDIVATPEFSIPGGTFTEPISVAISCATEGADIYYTTDGSDPDQDSEPYVLPIPISETTTLKARAYAEDYNPSFIATAVYTFPETVATLAELRAGTLGNTYIVTGEVWVTFQLTGSTYEQKYIQDATAAILIYDPSGAITSDFEIGDGIVGLSGVLETYGGMLELVPDSDPGDPVSSGNFPEPQVITIDELFTNFENYECELVKLSGVSFADGGTPFAAYGVYPMSDLSDATGDFRASFPNVDYIGTTIPNITFDIVGLPNSTNDGNFITSRSLDDFELGNILPTPTFDPPGGSYATSQEVEILCDNNDADIYYTTDGSDPDENSTLFIDPITISETKTLKAIAYLDGFDPSLIATAQYNFPLANLAELRAGIIGSTYTIAGEIWLTYQQTNRNQKFFQDASGGILIDDAGGVITSDYEIGDGITGLSGVLGEYGGMLQFVPDTDPGDPVSSGNFPEPQVVTIGELFSNFEMYESELVIIETATFADGGSTFATGTVYAISDDSEAEGNFRTSFYDADYIGTDIPLAPTDIIGIPNSRTDGEYITSRSSADLIENAVPPAIIVLSPNGGEIWEQGETYDITWGNINFTGNVNVNITKAPFTNISLAANIANTGSWSWTIPEAFATGDYKIKVTGVTPGDPFDSSDETFAISEPLPDPVIVINEIMYNPATSLGNDADYEYLELYNNSGFAVDITGWSIATAITYTFEAGTVMATDSYLVIALKPDTIIAHYGINNVVGPFSGGLNNTGEPVELKDAFGNLHDIVTYADGGDWPSEPDGSGPSLELLDPDLDNSLPENWSASFVNDGTPGMQNSVFGAEILTLVTPNGGETFEQGSSQEITWTYIGFTGELMIKLIDVILEDTTTLATNVPVEFGLWDWEVASDLTPGENYKIMIAEVGDGEPMDESDAVFTVVEVIVPVITLTSPNGGEAWAQGTAHDISWTSGFFEGDVKIELNDGAKALTLIEDSIPVANGTFTWDIPGDLATGDNYTIVVSGMVPGEPTDESDAPFSITAPQPFPEVVINEIMYNSPESGTDTLEFIELYNMGEFSVNLQNWSFGQGVTMVFPDYELGSGEYVVTAYSASVMLDAFGITALQWDGGGLSNGGETIELLNDSGEQVDIVSYDDGGLWTMAPDGYGPTLALIDPSTDNTLAENWSSETVFAFDHPAGIPMFASPGAINYSTPGQGMMLSSGWTGISTYTNLVDPSVATNMDFLINDLVVMQDFSNLYFPQYSINTIGDWDYDKGYQLKIDNYRYLVLYGEAAVDKTVSLVAGWNGLPVLSACDVEAATLFSGVGELIFVKEMGGDKVYWPEGSLFTLEYLEPGKAYFIKVSADVSITFPECAAVKSAVETSQNQFINNTSWNNVTATAASHTFGIDAVAMSQYNEGDVVGIFTGDGYCAGMVSVSKENTALMAWADDIYTNAVNGFADGEALNFKLFVQATGEDFDLIPTFDSNYDSEGAFVSHGITRIVDFKTSATGISETEASVSVYPNPTSGLLSINTNGFDYLEVYSVVGQKVFETQIPGENTQINVNTLDNGFYFIKFVNSKSGDSKSINFIKN